MKVRCYDWFSYSHWGLFRLPLFTTTDWHAFGIYDTEDDDLLEEVDGESADWQGQGEPS